MIQSPGIKVTTPVNSFQIKSVLYKHATWMCFLVTVIVINIIFKLIFTPSLDKMGKFSLIVTPEWITILKSTLVTNPFYIFKPIEYFPGKVVWITSTIIPLYLLYKIFTPLVVYLLVSTIFLIVTYLCTYNIFKSNCMSFIATFMLALGTQLNYSLTMGCVLIFYIQLSYIVINVTFLLWIFRSPVVSLNQYLLFLISLLLCALSFETWINYAVILLASLGFLIAWAKYHKFSDLISPAKKIIFLTALTLIVYFMVESRSTFQYLKLGGEEELIFTYKNPLLALDDVIVNFFTFLYMVLSNYLPSFLFFSTSATYLDQSFILSEQHGYHEKFAHLVIMNHIFMWRFYAGIFTVLFFIKGWKTFLACLNDKYNIRAMIICLLWLAIIFGFTTHLFIKMRPYNSTPMLGYKAVISTFFFTILIAFVVTTSKESFKQERNWRYFLMCILVIVFLSALTRPAALNAGLKYTGMVGYGDPASQLITYMRNLRTH